MTACLPDWLVILGSLPVVILITIALALATIGLWQDLR